MRYCFLTYGNWDKNAGLLRPRELGTELIRRGHEVSYLVDDYPYNREHLGLHPQARIEFVPHPASWRQIPARRRALARLDPNYVHVMNPNLKSYLALARLGAARWRVVGEWDEPPVLKDYWPWTRRQLERGLDRWLRRRADVHVVCARYLQEYFRARWGLATAYIPHATYLPRYDDGPSPYARPTAVYMGNMYHTWDLDLIFDAARLLAEQGCKPAIAFVGDGPDRAKWTQFIHDHHLDNVMLAGYRRDEDLWRHVRHAHVLLFPIRPTLMHKTRCPSKTFAYAQSRRPIITCRVGEVAEILGDRATYVEATPAGFAAAIRTAMAAPALPDVDYGVEKHNYADRAERLLEAITGQSARPH